jgi:hypothetical protein
MTFGDFIMPEIEEYKGLPEGEYTAQVDHVELMRGDKYGDYFIVNWRILRPSEFEGSIHQERFSIKSENDQVRHIAIQNFAKLCRDVGGLKLGDQPKESDLLFKVANILIRDKTSKDGRVFKKVIRHELVNEGQPRETAATILSNHAINGIAGSGMQPLPTNPLPSDALNDQVPF